MVIIVGRRKQHSGILPIVAICFASCMRSVRCYNRETGVAWAVLQFKMPHLFHRTFGSSLPDDTIHFHRPLQKLQLRHSLLLMCTNAKQDATQRQAHQCKGSSRCVMGAVENMTALGVYSVLILVSSRHVRQFSCLLLLGVFSLCAYLNICFTDEVCFLQVDGIMRTICSAHHFLSSACKIIFPNSQRA